MPKSKSYEKLVPDTSVIIEGLLSYKIDSKEISVNEVIIHEAVLAELEHQANEKRAIGILGLEELEKLKDISEKNSVKLYFLGKKPSAAEIKHASLGEIDSMIRDLAFDEGATLLTADKIQAKAAKVKGVEVEFLQLEKRHKDLKLEKYFDNKTMSVHIREEQPVKAKRGVPGSWEFIDVTKSNLNREDVQDISREIIEDAGIRRDGFVEIERVGSTIVQLGNYRIVITRPPFSDGWEITAVRPVRKLVLDDYTLSEKLHSRIAEQAEGILIAGSPGMGKSTFSQALAEFYASQGKVVKTVEAPRDMVLPESVTQYAISHGSPQEVHDVLLLSRPDNTIFDEMRNTEDFRLFTDLRLAGIGLAGVVHATNPVDAIQRFVGRIELGVIPQVVDTVIFIKNGQVFKVLSIHMVVKVPAGMTEADLARPVVVVDDFETNKTEFEMYSYGEETVVVPVDESKKFDSGLHSLAAKSIEEVFRRYTDDLTVEMISDKKVKVYVPENVISKIIGKKGSNIDELEKELRMSIDVEALKFDQQEGKKEAKYDFKITKKKIVFTLSTKLTGKDIFIYVNDDYLLTTKLGKGGQMQIKGNNKIGRILIDALNNNENVKLLY